MAGCDCTTHLEYGCLYSHFTYSDGSFYAREYNQNPCTNCGIRLGYHHYGCLKEVCPRCSLQKNLCSCEGKTLTNRLQTNQGVSGYDDPLSRVPIGTKIKIIPNLRSHRYAKISWLSGDTILVCVGYHQTYNDFWTFTEVGKPWRTLYLHYVDFYIVEEAKC